MNVSLPKEIVSKGKTVRTGNFKEPVHGRVGVKTLNIEGDGQAKQTEAERLYKKSLSIREKVLGPEHPDVAQSLENYALLLRRTNREAESAKMEPVPKQSGQITHERTRVK